jgi:ketosteroid isomerase-like protein
MNAQIDSPEIDTPEMDTPKKRLEYVFGETAKGNGQPFLDALAEDAEWTVIGSTGWSKTYRGKAAISRHCGGYWRRRARPTHTI